MEDPKNQSEAADALETADAGDEELTNSDLEKISGGADKTKDEETIRNA